MVNLIPISSIQDKGPHYPSFSDPEKCQARRFTTVTNTTMKLTSTDMLSSPRYPHLCPRPPYPHLTSYLFPGSGKAGSQTQADGGVRVESPGGAAEPGLGSLHDPRARAQHPPVQASSQPACLN